LLELILVVIIIGILASLGLTNYSKTVEKSRLAEAKMILGQIRSAEEGYKLENSSRTTDLSLLGLGDLPTTTCTTNYYYRYTSTTTAGTATRCISGGKTPNYATAYTVTLDYDAGTWTSTGP